MELSVRLRDMGSFDCVRLGLTSLRMTSFCELGPDGAMSLRCLLSWVWDAYCRRVWRVRTLFRAVGRVREMGSFDCVRLGLTSLRMTSGYVAPDGAAMSLRHLLSGCAYCRRVWRVRTLFRAVGRVRETGSFDCVRLGLTSLRMTSVCELAPYAAATSLRHLLSGVKARRTLPPMALLYPAFT